MLLALLPLKIWANEILSRFTVRIHSRIIEKGRSWARLWYLLRGFDRRGSGYIRLSVTMICHLLGAASSSLYQWLREMKNTGAIRWWKCQRGNLRVALGGLFNVCRSLGLSPDSKKRVGISPWGTTSEIPLHQILNLQSLRAAATASTAQRLQQLSRYAAWRKLPAPARKIYRLPQPEAFFQNGGQQRLSDNSAVGSIRCLIHIGKRRAWVSKGFVPFGTSQHAIALERGMSDRTIRRHLALANVDRRQVVQAKAEYRLAAECLHHDGGGVEVSEDVILRAQGDDYFLNEKGLGGRYTHKVGEVGFSRIHSRFFTYGKKPKTWLYRCNIYKPVIKLCTMSRRKREYLAAQTQQEPSRILLKPELSSTEILKVQEVLTAVILQNGRGAGDVTTCKRGKSSLENSKPERPTRQKKTDIFHKKENSAAEFEVGDRVFVAPWPHTDRLGPYPIERIEGDYAKVEMFASLLPLADLRKA